MEKNQRACYNMCKLRKKEADILRYTVSAKADGKQLFQ